MTTRRLFVSGSAAADVTGVATRAAATRTPPQTSDDGPDRPIDRKAVVARHRVVRDAINAHSPLQVGNGSFAFGVDVTGLQTFVPFNTMSEWGWHSFPLPPGEQPSDFHGEVWDTHGRAVEYPIPNPAQPELSRWLYANSARINLGRIGLELTLPDGRTAVAGDLTGIRQELDLWTGIIDSRFELAGEPVHVRTCCHPDRDAVAVEIASPLVAASRLAVFFDFPYADQQEFAEHVGTYCEPDAHQTTATTHANRPGITHRMDSTEYHVEVAWQGRGVFASTAASRHRYCLAAAGGTDRLHFVCTFAPAPAGHTPSAQTSPAASSGATFAASIRSWRQFWLSGGAVDLSESEDPRWRELERRIVLSQYLLRANEAGSLPPQESGLVNNCWHGKFHMEMYWWHGAHWALWNRWPILERSLSVFDRFHDSSRARAQKQGFRGARWPKCTTADGSEAPHVIHALLMWQQPHPLFLAELDYQAHPTKATLGNWREIVADTADFLASWAFWDDSTSRYVLGPPMHLVSENTDPRTTQNPTFELSYWRFGLRVAQQWRERLGLPRDPQWQRVHDGLAALPVQDDSYVLHEGVENMWTVKNYEHPALIGAFGWLPGDGVDIPTMGRTADRVFTGWRFSRTWGWDFPMLAMCAARLGRPDDAVDFLLHPSGGFQFDDAGLATGGPFPYFPSNGALLYAIAFMTAGWDGSPDRRTPGFPAGDRWVVRSEGLTPAL
ncbi:hypothetical protein OHA18_41185 [Kribbella sp. NBC_00709]|uniref:hypothetical protein n=1 Tax=Kribbella sp. NBC_00709 TaxID=2975972 RepID=UPI002E2CA47E|nr:hypothetical protein [Kribbella sp. NBC_00709]